MDKFQALTELLKDEAIAEAVLSESVEETQENLKKYNLDFSVEELEEYAKQVSGQEASGEISEDSLENVTGGGLGTYIVARVLAKWLVKKLR